MKKLKIPKIVMPEIKNKELAIKNFNEFMEMTFHSDLEPKYDFNVNGFCVEVYIDYSCANDEHYIYALITDSEYCYNGNIIIETERYYFHTYEQYLSAVKKMNKDLINGWKQWVKQLYEEVK